MKYIKLFEYEWFLGSQTYDSIKNVDGELHVSLYELANEMENSVEDIYPETMVKKEEEYFKLVRKLLIGNVITFSCADCNENSHTGICDNVHFSSGDFSDGDGADNTEAMFQTQFIHISTEDMNDSHSIEDDDVTIHNDDPDLYRNMKKYNL